MSSPESPEDVLERVLESLQDDFLKFVVAKAIAHKALAKKIIPETVETLILNAGDRSSANHFLFAHLRSQATVKDLRELCSIMKEAEGNSRMNGFGSTLEAELDKSFPRQENAAIDGRLMQPRCGHCGAESGAVASPAENTSLSSCAKVQKVVERGEFEGLDSLADSFAITVGYIVGDLITESMLAPLKTVALNKVKLKRIPNPPSRADINNANDIQQLFDLLHIDSNWVDITLLEQIVKVSRSESAASNLSDYKKSHERVIADALACLVDPSTDGTCPRPDANSGILQLVFSDEREGMRVQEVLACKQFLCHRFGVQPESIKFLSAVISNSLVVTWLVSRHTGWKIVNQCRSPPVLAVLQEMEVIAVRLRYPGFSVGINVTLDASKGCAHMEEAVCSGALKQVQELTQKGVDMNEGNIMDKASDVRHSPLIVTIQEGHEDVALELLSAGVDIHVKDDGRRTALHWACEKGLEKVVEALISLGSHVDERDLFGLTPVMLAADSSKTEISLHLVRAGASCEGLSKDHMKFLFCRACCGAESDLTAVRTLLKEGCSVDIISKEKQEELLCHACHKGDMLVVEHLIGHGCSVSCVSVDGYPPLMLAAQEGHEEVVKKLILAGANLGMQDEQGNTALHYAAVNRHIQCGINLVEGGASVSVENKSFEIPLDLAKDDFKETILQTMSYKTRKIVSIIGNAAGGKSTLVTSLQSEGKVFSQLGSPDDKPRQTAGIETVTHCSQSYGEVLLFDFAGQHKYHGPQQMFLESLFSITGTSVTILLVVNVTGKERIILNQLHHWLTPLALMDTPGSPRVIIVGSFLDKVMFKQKATTKLTKCIDATRSDLEGLPLEIVGSCLLNCCQPHSEGMDQLCRFLREIPIPESTHKQYSLPWVLSQIRSSFKAPAVQLQELSEWIQDNKDRLPRTMPSPEEVCQNLSAAGHALYLPNMEDPAKSWLVLDLPIILQTVYGTLFSQTKVVINEFGLLPCQYLAELFPDMHQEMIEQLLISLKFCIPVDPSLLKIEVMQLSETEEASRWLFIPALISANPLQPTSEGLPQQSIHSLCWQLKASKKHYISARVLQSILLHLAPHFIEKQGQKKVVQQQRDYRIWRNGIAWQPIVGVDVTVHISKEMIKVVTSSIKSADKLCRYLIDVIGDIISIVRRLSPKLAATAYIVHPPNLDALYKSVQVPSKKLYPVELVQSLVSNGEEHISLEKSNRTAIAISDLFEGRTPSLEDIGRLNWTEPKRIHLQSSVESSGAQRLQAVQTLQVLDEFRAQFIQDMDSNAVVLDLLNHAIISRGDQRTITRTEDPTEQNAFLHLYLKEKCTEDAFHLVCDIISKVKGNPKMSTLGTAMKQRLVKGDEWGVTPLMEAAYHGHANVVVELIRAGADVSVVSSREWWLVAAGSTALHFAAKQNSIECGVLLVEAGADMRTRNKSSKSPLGLASHDFQQAIQQAQSFSTKRIVAVIGEAEHGKSTLIAALQAEGNSLLKKFTNKFRKVRDIKKRTTGIEAVQFSSEKYGDTLFYDFVGQSNYHGPHQSFLEAMLSRPGVSLSLLLLLKTTDKEDVITRQVTHWLQPLSLTSAPSTPQVILVGSFLDQVESREEATKKLLRCTMSVQEQFHFNIQGPCLLDCRKPASEGIDQICTLFQENEPLQFTSSTLSYNLHWVLVQVRKAFSDLAVTFHRFQSWLLENGKLLPTHMPPAMEVCHDLTSVGHALFLPNKRDPFQSLLILDLQAILHDVYGTLFSGSQGKVNQFGLLHCSQLTELFPKSEPAMIQEVLISLEFCIQVDSSLLREELLKLTARDEGDSWLYFPALVSALPLEFFPHDPHPQHLQWACWQLRTAKKHFISAHLLQTIILRLAANHVLTHELSPSVREHCCSVWVNGLSWRSTKGVDMVVQISDSSVVQVVGRTEEGSEKLHQYMSTIVSDVIKTTAQLSPKLEATSYIVHPYTPAMWEGAKALPPDSLYPVSSIIRSISDGGGRVLSLPRQGGRLPHQTNLTELFGGRSPPLSVVQEMDFKRGEPLRAQGEPTAPQHGQSHPDGKDTRSHFSIDSTPSFQAIRKFIVRQVASDWSLVAIYLGLETSVIRMARADHPQQCEHTCADIFERWLSWEEGTGERERTWHTVLSVVEEAGHKAFVNRLKAERFNLH